MTTNKTRVGVVGVGHLGQHHARWLSTMDEVTLVGVADARPEQARAVADRCGTLAFTDYRDLIGKVDAVSVAVPTSLHRSVAGAFLARGIATMIEKPLATTLADAEELVTLARARKALLQVGHIERFNPALHALDGIALRPKYVSAERLSTYTFRSTDIGVVLDLMIHDIDLILSMNPTPVRLVQAVGVSVFGGHEDIANARIEFEDGCVANLTASRASFQASRKMRLYGAEGYAALDFATREGTLIRPSERLLRGELATEGLDFSAPAVVKERIFGTILQVDKISPPGGDALGLELADFVRAVRGVSRPKVSGDDALRAMRVADQVLRSLNSHAWEGLPDGPTGPHVVPVPNPDPIPGLDPAHSFRGPLSWRLQGSKTSTNSA